MTNTVILRQTLEWIYDFSVLRSLEDGASLAQSQSCVKRHEVRGYSPNIWMRTNADEHRQRYRLSAFVRVPSQTLGVAAGVRWPSHSTIAAITCCCSGSLWISWNRPSHSLYVQPCLILAANS